MKDKIIQSFLESANLKVVFAKKNIDQIIRTVETVADAIHQGNKVILFGNGGSAADAQHIAAEFINRFIIDRPPLPAIALTTDTSVITSISNDSDFSCVFSKQIKALGKEGDVAFGLSTSGDSENVIKALYTGKKLGIKTVGITGKDGGRIASIVDISLNVASSNTARVQEVHIAIGHIICEMVELLLFRK
ncbi:MAG: D-sedoheptulose 7-phosphate isomerase [Thermodesulfobacteriota bacterium]|nr:D-sedoheptulose 7-phosphate isomerase [Thermodesulfobacteriota bacterium]